MFDRRSVLAGLALLGGGGWRRAPVPPLLERAMARAGGQAALADAAVLRWRGRARVAAGERMLDIGVSTRVEPFQAARTDTWLLAQGPATMRSMIIEGDRGWIERDGRREPMPARMLAHERAQFAIYGLMLLAPLSDRGASAAPAPARDGLDCLAARHPGAPDTLLCFDGEARLAQAFNQVPAPETGAPVDQRFDFGGEIDGGGVRWPRRLSITGDGKPYFDLELSEFSVKAAEPDLRGDARTGQD